MRRPSAVTTWLAIRSLTRSIVVTSGVVVAGDVADDVIADPALRRVRRQVGAGDGEVDAGGDALGEFQRDARRVGVARVVVGDVDASPGALEPPSEASP